MKQRLAAPSDVIDLRKLPELKGITVTGDAVTIGAATTHAEVNTSDAVKKAIPALAYLASLIGDPAVRHMGTIGGSLANNDPAADYPAAVMALNATIKTDKRTIAAEDFFTGLFSTALEPGEIIVSVTLPGPGQGRLCQVRQPRLALRDGRRVRGQAQGRRGAGRRHRRPWRRRLPLGRHREGADRVVDARGRAGGDGRARTACSPTSTARPPTAPTSSR